MTAPSTPDTPEGDGPDDVAPGPVPGPSHADAGARDADTTGATGANGFVREARPEDLAAIGSVHAASMLASLEAGHRGAHGTGLPEGVRAMISAPVIATGWQEAVTSPPSREHHVLVATQAGSVVGLLGLAPTQSLSTARAASDRDADPGSPEDGASEHPAAGAGALAPTGAGGAQGPLLLNDAQAPEDREPLPAAEVTALGVDPAHQRRGHGSRLLAAAADTARGHGARALVVWAVRGDESLSWFLRSAGLEPTGAQRQLGVGQGVTEDCWVAGL
ncbi:GNAT family N-acetyltransferase [Actinomyces wuliandei]|uniref:GNAT family N-acetyltransferase n=1 Tax=Actinomyces wuliandei TaxID=2057743 RepID=UPI000FD78DF4|nr:GNAT family N-acetyltransferase [Actinomyces wuliandei]